MKLEKAIEILTKCHGHGGIAHNKDYVHAQKLGIEAIKRLQWTKECRLQSPKELLPGETED